MKLFFILLLLLWCLLDHDFICVISDGVSVSVMEGDSITLHTDVKIKQQEDIKWYFNGICISQISDVQSKNCTDDQCEDMGYGRFTNRLIMNCHTGSLTITSTSTTDSGVYKLKIFINSSDSEKTFIVTVHGSSGVVADEVSVMEGDSVTLHTGVQTNQQDRIRWYYKDIRIAQINRDQSKVCTDVQCNDGTERFRGRLKLDHQTGSLTITNTTTEDSGEYQLQISSGSSDSEKIFIITLYDVSTAERDKMKKKSVKEGESVTLYTAVIRELNDYMAWYFNDVLIAEITGDQSQIYTDDQCKERFRDRLKLDHQTGALTITHTRHTDSGEYKLQINSSRFSIIRSFSVSVTGVFSAYTGGVSVSVMEGDSVTLQTGVQTNQQDRIRWYYKDIRIAQINRDQSKVCTDVQCNEGTERFRDRLKLDHQTGSLTITNTTTEDSGEYQLQISSGSSDSEKIFIITLYGVSAAERDKIKKKSVKEGESVTLDPAVMKNTNDVMAWYYNDVLIAEITGDQSQICTDDQCKERFRDRLKLDHPTGALTITHTRHTDSGEYKLQINSSRFSVIRSFSVSVTAVPGSGLSSAAVAGISVTVVLLAVAAAAAVIYLRRRQKDKGTQRHDQENRQGALELNPMMGC